MPRAKQVCSTAGCVRPVTARGKCLRHDPGPWATSDRRSRLPSNWSSLRLAILRRDKRTCYVCGGEASEVDHVQRGDDHSPANLRAICAECHQRKTLAER
ncbi:HNH endonuclease [Nonomuraea sp. NPDC023979]|uniref:HNH endonuclease n=1 Tax=Nonomuraea sp. NPDC023979 TaxID=3154796 RepID=UPI0033CF322D